MDKLTTDTDPVKVANEIIAMLKEKMPERNIRAVGMITGEVDIAVLGDDGQDWIVRVYHPWS